MEDEAPAAGSAPASFALFTTAIGLCAIAWRGERVIATLLPEGGEAATRRRMQARAPGAREASPPPAIARAIAAITALLEGEPVDLSFIACDLEALEPRRAEIYRIARAIPPGETLTYGEIARRLGDARLAQAVGQAMGRNPLPIIVPCHRVLGAGGRMTGFSARGGIETKLRMLAIEGAEIGTEPGLFGALPLAVKPARCRRQRS